MIYVIPNGIDMSYFDRNRVNTSRDHSIFWSSNTSRGLDILIQYIFPLVRRCIPDIQLIISSPSYSQDSVCEQSNIKYLGHLSKSSLYEEMYKHSCWYYPSTFNETFCITSVEMALCGCDIVLPIINGPATTFKQFKDRLGMKTIYSNGMEFINESVTRIVNSIIYRNTKENNNIRMELFDYLFKNYSWDRITRKFRDILKDKT